MLVELLLGLVVVAGVCLVAVAVWLRRATTWMALPIGHALQTGDVVSIDLGRGGKPYRVSRVTADGMKVRRGLLRWPRVNRRSRA